MTGSSLKSKACFQKITSECGALQQHQLWALLSGSGWLGWRTAGMPLDLCGGKLAALPIDPLLPLLPSPLLRSLLAAQ